jgi:hypothetical protein
MLFVYCIEEDVVWGHCVTSEFKSIDRLSADMATKACEHQQIMTLSNMCQLIHSAAPYSGKRGTFVTQVSTF